MRPRAFSLIEVLLYSSLCAILLCGALSSAYALLTTSARSGLNPTPADGTFVLGTIDWVLSNAASITAPSATVPYSSSLSIVRHDGSTVTIRARNSAIEIEEPDGSYLPLTGSRALVSQLQFHYLTGAFVTLTASTTINGADFGTTRVLSYDISH